MITKPIKVHVDGVTHLAAHTRSRTQCGVELLNLDLDTLLRVWSDAQIREVDCMTCIAEATCGT